MSDLREAHIVYTMLTMDGGRLREYGPMLLVDRLPDSVEAAVDLVLRGRAAYVAQEHVLRVRAALQPEARPV